MRTLSATEAKQGLAGLLDMAAREPVIIRRQKRNVAVVLSMQEYERLTRLNVSEFQRFCDAIGDKADIANVATISAAESYVVVQVEGFGDGLELPDEVAVHIFAAR